MLVYLRTVVSPGDKVLAQSGAATILATYEGNHPENTTTFDWFEYRKLNREDAYIYAVRDGFFNVIELEKIDDSDDKVRTQISNLIRSNLADNYVQIYSKDGFDIYKRTF